ncbi:MAG: hypothetical protein KF906_05770 [Actinobacteria bacterium]|nr:hypothetical protein [Actinomycetota bacterium]
MVDRAPVWMRGIAVVVVALLVAGAVYVVTSSSGPDYPDAWDSRVADLAKFVEKERGLEYEHPVTVNFLTAEEYTAASSGDTSSAESETSEEEQAQLDDTVAMLRALGLVEGEVDLEAATSDLADSGTLAFYSPDTKEVYVRGTDLTPALRVTLVHELTHVVQDQHFDLSRISDTDDNSVTYLRDIGEGDATRIENLYIDDVLTAKERKEYDKESQASSDDAEEGLTDVPQVLQVVFAAPYFFGPVLVDLADAQQGNAGIDALLEDPPSDAAMFDPVDVSPFENPAVNRDPLTVELPDGAEEIDGSETETFGSVFWYVLLASRIDPKAAYHATVGLEADGMRSYRLDGAVCVSARAQMSDAQNTTELETALQQWVGEFKGGAATASASGTTVSFQSCDPGEDALAGDVDVALLQLPVTRTQIFTQGITEGLREDQARCYADGVMDIFSGAELTSDDFNPTAEQQSAILRAGAACR